MSHYSFDPNVIPDLVETFSNQGQLSKEAAAELGLKDGITVGYRAGDQPNNAFSLNVLEPGEIAATGGTSGVVYGVYDQPVFDPESRINSFAHVNHHPDNPKIGVLLCINGAGIMYGWMRAVLDGPSLSYEEIERTVREIPIGSDGLQILPFGNGAERILNNKITEAGIHNLQLNRHKKAHLYRASLEGIAYSFVYGIEIMREMGLDVDVIKVGNDNLFQSRVFSETITNILDCRIEMMEATGAVGAAKGSGIGAGIYNSTSDAFTNTKPVATYEAGKDRDIYQLGYHTWKNRLLGFIKE
jgi:xylulokinase